MQYRIGIDAHKRYSQVTVTDPEGGNRQRYRLNHGREEYRAFFERYRGNGKAALESTRNWYWMADVIQECDIDFVLANPKQLKAIAWARVKTDKVDADTINALLRADLLPACYVAPPEVRQKRELLRYRAALVRTRTGIKNRIHALVDRYGVSHAYSDLFSQNGRGFLRRLPLPQEARQALSGHVKLVEELDGMVAEADARIAEAFDASREARHLDTIPGVGVHWGLLIAYEVGTIDRFDSATGFTAYCGLVPTIHSSGGKTYLGQTSPESNHWLRTAFVEAARSSVVHPTERWHYLRYQQLKLHKGDATAIVALAREFAVSAYYMLKRGEDYKELRPVPKPRVPAVSRRQSDIDMPR